MSIDTSRRPYYWQRHTAGDGRWLKEQKGGPPGDELAALRRGLGREAGEVPQMWRFYTQMRADGNLHPRLHAEHAALSLFALHQQSKAKPMQQAGVGLGTALLQLRRSGKFSPDSVDRRFAAAATASSFPEVVAHLRGLISQLHAIDQGLDYTQLVKDLTAWQTSEQVATVRRRWGAQYFTAAEKKEAGDASAPAPRTPIDASTTETVWS